MDVTARLSAALQGRYRIERELGAGGMATVYLAQDQRHDRKVALKVLKPELAAVVGAERFLTEIKTTANLQHPHILPLFDSGEADSFLFYVMPYVEGESLRERLKRKKQLPVDEAVRIGAAVAHALDYAHRHGVIHRDVKPENVLLHDGQPMVADFGIALAVSAAGGGRLTETGLSLGTPYYMSPEQAAADRDPGPASDVYSLACVLYEMLAGDPPHTGSTAQAVLAKILTAEPRPVTEARRAVPPHVEAALARALERLPADRFESAEAFARALGDPAFRYGTGSGAAASTSGAGVDARPRVRAATLAPWIVAAAATALSLWGWLAAPDLPAAPATVRTTVRLPMPTGGIGRRIAISPDGRWIAYTSTVGATNRVYVRRADQEDVRELAGTDGATSPDFSPDGRWIVFASSAGLLKIPTDGGPTLVLARNATFANPSWGRDGFIYCEAAGAIARVSEAGGEPEVLVPPPTDGSFYRFPVPLPEGKGVLFTRLHSREDADVALVDLGTRAVTPVLSPGAHARYLPTGHLVYGHTTQSLMAVPFDLDRRAVTGAPSPALPLTSVFSGGATQFAVSDAGTAVYLTQSQGSQVRLVLMSRDGSVERLPVTAFTTRGTPRFSPDGKLIAFEDDSQIHVYDIVLGTNAPLTFEGFNRNGSWLRDGRTLAMSSTRSDSDYDPYLIAADGSGPARPILSAPGSQHADGGWSPDGKLLLGVVRSARGDLDLQVISLGDTVTTAPYLQGTWNEQSGRISPDGRFVAYVSDESGRFEVYVRTFPNPAGRVQISTQGGAEPVWAPDGKRLHYRAGNAMLEAAVASDPTFRVLGRDTVFADLGGYLASGYLTIGGAAYDVSPDGRRFVFFANEGQATDADAMLTVVTNWFGELRERLGQTEGTRR